MRMLIDSIVVTAEEQVGVVCGLAALARVYLHNMQTQEIQTLSTYKIRRFSISINKSGGRLFSCCSITLKTRQIIMLRHRNKVIKDNPYSYQYFQPLSNV
jgi:hypothetical protein